MRAFLHLEAGLTRDSDGSSSGEALRASKPPAQKLQTLKKRLADKNREIKRLEEALDRERKKNSNLANDDLYRAVEAVLDPIPRDFGGGCSLDKAYMLASLIRDHDLERSLDIGVYRGRSLFPQAAAHRLSTGGVAYGVDPWSASEAHENDNKRFKKAIERFVEETNFQEIYEEVQSMVNRLHLEDHCTILRQTSTEAAKKFREEDITFDLIHIDGNHDTAKVMEDVQNYLPLLRENGYMVVDDVSWESVQPVLEVLRSRLSFLMQRVQDTDDYAVFWNGQDPTEIEARRDRVSSIANNEPAA